MTSIKIGKLNIKYHYFPSPLAGLTDLPFRRLLDSIGYAGALFTEMISVEGLIRKNPQTLLMIKNIKSDTPKFVQLFGSNPETFKKAVRYINEETDFDGIDLNAGCPVKKVVNKGAGAYLLKDLSKFKEIIRAIRSTTDKAFTVKIRLGFNSVNVFEIAKIVEGEGVDAIIVHFRTKKDGYSKPARWEFAKPLKEKLNIPLIGNGDLFSVETAKEKLKIVDGIMIGRGIVINPSFFKEIETGKREREDIIIKKFIEYMEDFYPEEKWLPRLKAFLRYFSKGKGIPKQRKNELFISKDYSFVKQNAIEIFSNICKDMKL